MITLIGETIIQLQPNIMGGGVVDVKCKCMNKF